MVQPKLHTDSAGQRKHYCLCGFTVLAKPLDSVGVTVYGDVVPAGATLWELGETESWNPGWGSRTIRCGIRPKRSPSSAGGSRAHQASSCRRRSAPQKPGEVPKALVCIFIAAGVVPRVQAGVGHRLSSSSVMIEAMHRARACCWPWNSDSQVNKCARRRQVPGHWERGKSCHPGTVLQGGVSGPFSAFP